MFKKTIQFSFIILFSIDSFSQTDFINQLPSQFQSDVMRSLGTDSSSLNAQNESEKKSRKNIVIQDIPTFNKDIKEITLEDLERYGLSIFKKNNLYFRPSQNVPIPSDYLLGVGDKVRVKTSGQIQIDQSITVERDGMLNIPEIGLINGVGTLEEIYKAIKQKFNESYIGTEVFVTVAEVKDIDVFVLGAVQNPGSYLVNSLSSVLNVINVAGGVADFGSLRRLSIIRDNNLLIEIDLYDALINGLNVITPQLKSNDIIFVKPVSNLISVYGAVNRPAIYEVTNGEKLSDIIKFAQGYKTDSAKDAVSVTYIDSEGISQEVSDKDLDAGNMPNGTIVFVPFLRSSKNNLVSLKGSFIRNVSISSNRMNNSKDYYITKNISLSTYKPFFVIKNGTYHEFSNLENLKKREFNPGDEVFAFSNNDIKFLNNPILFEAISGVLDSRKLNLVRRVVGLQRDIIEDSKAVTDSVSSLMNPLNVDAMVEDIDYKPGQDLFSKIKQQDSLINLNRSNCSSLEYISQISETTKLRSIRDRIKSFVNFEDFVASSEDNDDFDDYYYINCPFIFDQNPDLLLVTLSNLSKVIGDVLNAGLYPTTSGTQLSELFNSLGGYTSDSNNQTIEKISFSGIRVTSSNPDGINISPGDVINVKSNISFKDQDPVVMSGEFNNPGIYIVQPGDKLSEIVNRAGGYTKDAYPIAGVLVRKSALEREKQALEQAYLDIINAITTAIASGQIQQNAESILALVDRFQSAKPTGRIITEFSLAKLRTNKNLDIIVEPGDYIFMPSTQSTVTVVGEVLKPLTLPHVDGMSYKNYLSLAGGLKPTGHSSSIYIVQPNGAARLANAGLFVSQKILPGSTIFVPRNPVPFNALQIANNVAPVLSSLALTAASLNSISD